MIKILGLFIILIKVDFVRSFGVNYIKELALPAHARIRASSSTSSANYGAVSDIDISGNITHDLTLSCFDYKSVLPISDITPSTEIIDGEFPSADELNLLPKGDRGGYRIIKQFIVCNSITAATLQSVLPILDSDEFPSRSKARKACRKGNILILRKKESHETNFDENVNLHQNNSDFWLKSQHIRGKVGDMIFPGDIIGYQLFMGTYKKKQVYPNILYARPQYSLPVVYEDDHFAIVNKPAGISVHGERRSKSGSISRRTVHFALPYILTPPRKGTPGGLLRRPAIVHRLDAATSGLLIVCKTKMALDSLSRQFRERKIQKIYTAIVNGNISSLKHMNHRFNSEDRRKITYAADDINHDNDWTTINYPLGQKYSETSFKIIRQSASLNAKDSILSLVELRPRTGRYHQLRRHMAWICRRPIVGDPLYAGLLQAHHFRKRGLFLCSNGVSLEHPFETSRIVEVTLPLPKRFEKLMDSEESWAERNNL